MIVDGLRINVLPDFIGWIFILIGMLKIRRYFGQKKYMTVMAAFMIITSAVQYFFEIFHPETRLAVLNIICNLVTTIFMFLLFGTLEQIAADHRSKRQSILGYLKIATVCVDGIITLISLIALSERNLELLALIFTVMGVVLLGIAVISAVVLFQFARDFE